MVEGKVVFVAELSDELNDQVVRFTATGLAALMIPNRVLDDEKIAALTDADFIYETPGAKRQNIPHGETPTVGSNGFEERFQRGWHVEVH